jgi:hypothetical protein
VSARAKPLLLAGQFDASGRKLFLDDCPRKYTGPIERADGVRPFNSYLWPTESWCAWHEPGRGGWQVGRFGIVALWDGSFAVNGFLWQIEKNNRRSVLVETKDQLHRPNNFPTRHQAIRAAAADCLRLLRVTRRSKHCNDRVSRDPQHFVDVCNWVRLTVHRETGHPCRPPRLATYAPTTPPTTPDLAADLPLFGGQLEAA